MTWCWGVAVAGDFLCSTRGTSPRPPPPPRPPPRPPATAALPFRHDNFSLPRFRGAVAAALAPVPVTAAAKLDVADVAAAVAVAVAASAAGPATLATGASKESPCPCSALIFIVAAFKASICALRLTSLSCVAACLRTASAAFCPACSACCLALRLFIQLLPSKG